MRRICLGLLCGGLVSVQVRGAIPLTWQEKGSADEPPPIVAQMPRPSSGALWAPIRRAGPPRRRCPLRQSSLLSVAPVASAPFIRRCFPLRGAANFASSPPQLIGGRWRRLLGSVGKPLRVGVRACLVAASRRRRARSAPGTRGSRRVASPCGCRRGAEPDECQGEAVCPPLGRAYGFPLALPLGATYRG